MTAWLLSTGSLLGQTPPGAPTGRDAAIANVGISDPAYALLAEHVAAPASTFFVYENADSGLNHGFPSGVFGSPGRIALAPGCVDDPAGVSGCAADRTRVDPTRGTVLAVTISPLSGLEFCGVNVEEPEFWSVNRQGTGYDLRGATELVFDVRVPTPGGLRVQFGVGERMQGFVHLPQSGTFETRRLPLSSLGLAPGDLTDVRVLFTVATNAANAPGGGTLLLDNIRFEPVPARQAVQIGLPLANRTFGVVPVQTVQPGRVKVPPDQLLRNVASTYESSITAQALFLRGTAEAVAHARRVADALVYALDHPNPGIPLPVASDGSRGLNSAYSSGELPFNSDQATGAGRRGDARLAGFSASPTLCGASSFCVVLDGATGGNNAFAIKALLAAFVQSGDQRYLAAARTIARWIHDRLLDPATDGFGGYFAGYLDGGQVPSVRIDGKSIENNADIFAAFTALASIERALGTADADLWGARARRAGDFVMAMFDPVAGRFHAGTVPAGTPAGDGIAPDGAQRGRDVINTFDFLDANTFAILALAESPAYRPHIDWRRPLQWALDHQARTVTAAGRPFNGFNLVSAATSGPQGVAWEFTGQMVVAMDLVDRLYGETRLAATAAFYLGQLRDAQRFAPSADGRGLPAATLQGGESVPPHEQCVSTPFQCIAQRIGLAATVWAIFAEAGFNPLGQTDGDGDGLPDSWELAFGLDAQSPLGDDGAAGDPDADGRTNAQELTDGTHPRGFHRRYLAEGALNAFFDVRFALLNVGPQPARVQWRFLQPGGITASLVETLPRLRRRTLARTELSALLSVPAFSTVVESDHPIVLDRTMSWGDGGYGSHAETGVADAATAWFLAEGSTSSDFALFYLIQNPNPTATVATIRYLLPPGRSPIEREYALPPNSRTTIAVDDQGEALASTDVSAVITSPLPVIAERAMYFSRPGRPFVAGHGSIGVTAPATSWFLAEGATGPFFDLFILIANPSGTAAMVDVDYLLSTGVTHTKSYTVPANARITIWVDNEQIPGGSGFRPLANVAVSTTVVSTNAVPIVVERAMWWPGPEYSADFWTEAHNSAGTTVTGTEWAMADGEVGGPQAAETYVLIANTSATPGQASLTLYFEDGASATRSFLLRPRSRKSVSVTAEFPEAAGRRFSAVVESLGPTPAQLVVERAMYTSPGGATWTAGTDALATRLR